MKKTRQQCTYSSRSSFHSCRHIVFVLSLSPRPSQPWLGTWHVLAKRVTRREPTKRVFVQFIETWPDPLVQRLSCGAYLRENNISVSCAPIWFSFFFFFLPPSLLFDSFPTQCATVWRTVKTFFLLFVLLGSSKG